MAVSAICFGQRAQSWPNCQPGMRRHYRAPLISSTLEPGEVMSVDENRRMNRPLPLNVSVLDSGGLRGDAIHAGVSITHSGCH